MPRTLEINPEPKQYLAWQALNDPAIAEIHFGGAAGGGKTWLGCESRLARAIAYPGYKSFIGRKELTRLMATTFITFQKVCKHHQIDQDDWHLNGKYNYIEFRNGSRIDLLDLALKPTDPMYERLGSLECTDGWVDEAGEVPFMAIDILQSRIGRHMNKEFNLMPDTLYTYNPNKGWVYRIYKAWKDGTLPADVVFIQSLFSDNSHTADIYGKQLDRIKDPAMKARLKLGRFEYDSDPTCLMNYDAINDLFTNTVTEGEKAMTIDVARHGVDKTVIYLWKGWKLYGVRIYAKQGVDVTAQKAKEIAAQERIPYSRSVADEDGVGGGVIDINRGFRGFVANSTALPNPITKEPENYANLKAQASYKLAEIVNSHQMAVSIEPSQFVSEVEGITYEVWKDMFIEELEQIKSKDADLDRKLRVRPKEEVKEEIGRSPDFSDTAMMRSLLEYPAVNAPSRVIVHKPRYSGFAVHRKAA
jgi:phage terminase large subunit